MQRQRTDGSRRRFCLGAAAAAAAAWLGAGVAAPAVNADHGRVIPPIPIPDIAVRCADGRTASIAALVRGRVTALHLMFTGCSTVCPIQGAIFQRLQSLLPDQGERRIQLLSLSIDPLSDTPAAMRAWLARADARPGWIAAAPDIRDLDRLQELFGQGRNAVENHATQVNVIDRRGELIWRSSQLPSPDALAAVLRQVAELV